MINNTLYRCSGYAEEVCIGCELGNPHEYDDGCCLVEDNCMRAGKVVYCIEYDRSPCGDPKCPVCTGGDGVSCKNKIKEKLMAKIKKYEPYFDEDGAYMSESPDGDYIKVSELRKWLEENRKKEHPYEEEYEAGFREGYNEALEELCAILTTEVK